MFNGLYKLLKRGHKEQKGITGLETAIILIAFVTVAAVFGYAVLSAGIFSAEKGKETVYLGLKEAKSTMELKGSIIAMGDNVTNPPTYVDTIKFTVGNAVAGEPIDLTIPPNNKTVLAYIDGNVYENDKHWNLEWVGDNDGDNLLEVGEKAEITVEVGDLDQKIRPNTKFTIEFKPPAGSTVIFERTIPANIDKVMDLY